MTEARDEADGLVAALRDNDGSARDRAQVLATVLDSEVLIPLAATSTESQPARIASVRTADERDVLPVFSSPASLSRWADQDIGFGLTTGQEAARITRDRGLATLVIDPGEPYAFALHPDEVGALASGIVPQPDGTGLVVGERIVSSPMRPVPDEVRRVAEEVADDRAVDAVYLFDARYGDRAAQPSLAVGVRFVPDSRDETDALMTATAERLAKVLRPDELVDLVVVDQELAAQLDRIVEAVRRPSIP
ncbi:MAG: SseB family protein [Actinomycetota bacterium]